MVIRKGDDTARSHIQSILEKNKKDKIISTENIVEFLENTVSVGTGVKSFDNNIFKLVDGREVVAGEYNCYISGGEDISIEYRYYMVKKIIN